ncbi:hypothetical protein HanRHA438_Chr07g0294061 [Helianthus annuus]|nr:hypothetical protein HanIR_Chr07g0305521 [Helianthus annuus]KAJ0907032.1 hypothetical protein HanRHA438_Chr07g0294061 [Helianthus annuus]
MVIYPICLISLSLFINCSRFFYCFFISPLSSIFSSIFFKFKAFSSTTKSEMHFNLSLSLPSHRLLHHRNPFAGRIRHSPTPRLFSLSSTTETPSSMLLMTRAQEF